MRGGRPGFEEDLVGESQGSVIHPRHGGVMCYDMEELLILRLRPTTRNV